MHGRVCAHMCVCVYNCRSLTNCWAWQAPPLPRSTNLTCGVRCWCRPPVSSSPSPTCLARTSVPSSSNGCIPLQQQKLSSVAKVVVLDTYSLHKRARHSNLVLRKSKRQNNHKKQQILLKYQKLYLSVDKSHFFWHLKLHMFDLLAEHYTPCRNWQTDKFIFDR